MEAWKATNYNPGPGHYSLSQNPLVGDIYKVSFFQTNGKNSQVNPKLLKGTTFPKGAAHNIFNSEKNSSKNQTEASENPDTRPAKEKGAPGPGSYYQPLEKKKMDHIVNKIKDNSGLYLGATPNLNQKFQTSILLLL